MTTAQKNAQVTKTNNSRKSLSPPGKPSPSVISFQAIDSGNELRRIHAGTNIIKDDRTTLPSPAPAGHFRNDSMR